MLVLSRRPNEQIMFPAFKTAVKVLSVCAGKVKLGIDAPRDVAVLREELTQGLPSAMTEPLRFAEVVEREDFRRLNHLLRNRLNVAGLGLSVLARQLAHGLFSDGQVTLEKLREDFDLLAQRLEGELKKKEEPPAKLKKTPKALLVEDDQNERALLAGFLRLSGVEVDQAGDGADALDYLRAHVHARPDVILLDMGLPRCDGPTTVREIRKDPANNDLKIFAVTGHPRDSFRLAGVDRWFRKPLDPEVLVRDLSSDL